MRCVQTRQLTWAGSQELVAGVQACGQWPAGAAVWQHGAALVLGGFLLSLKTVSLMDFPRCTKEAPS